MRKLWERRHRQAQWTRLRKCGVDLNAVLLDIGPQFGTSTAITEALAARHVPYLVISGLQQDSELSKPSLACSQSPTLAAPFFPSASGFPLTFPDGLCRVF